MARDQHKMEKRGFKAVGDTKKKKKEKVTERRSEKEGG